MKGGNYIKTLKEAVKQMSKKTEIIILISIIIILVIGICVGVGVNKRNEAIAQGQAMFAAEVQKNRKAINDYLYYAERYLEFAEDVTTKSSKESYKKSAYKYLQQATELGEFMTEAQYNKCNSLVIKYALL